MAGRVADRPAPDRDPGLQPERTSLAWTRTIIGYLVVAVVCLRVAPQSGPAGVVAGIAYLCVAVAIAALRTPRHRRHARGAPPVLEVTALSAITCALAVHWLVLSVR